MLIIGNWKMNGKTADVAPFLATLNAARVADGSKLVICPPFTLLSAFTPLTALPNIALGAQNCAAAAPGQPATGDICPAQLADLQCRYVIVGHSERRQRYCETNTDVKKKAAAAQAVGLVPIICLGDTLAQKQQEIAERAVMEQFMQSVPDNGDYIIAYEPVWAISDGKNGQPAQAHDIAGMHALIRAQLPAKHALIYGGSVKSDNAAQIGAIDNVDGFLIGGASLQPQSFLAIAKATGSLL